MWPNSLMENFIFCAVKNRHNSRRQWWHWSLDHYINLGQEIKWRQNKLTITTCRQTMTSLFLFLSYGQFGTISKPDSVAWSISFNVSLITTFYLTWIEKRTQINLSFSPLFIAENHAAKEGFFLKVLPIYKKNADARKTSGCAGTTNYIFWNDTYFCTYKPRLKFLP